MPSRKADRMSSLQCEILRQEPMFCFETSLKACVSASRFPTRCYAS